MSFRFQKRIRIFKGLTLNLSKSGTSWTLGERGASINVRKGKVTGTVGAPGTGLSYRKTLAQDDPERIGNAQGAGLGTVVFWFAVIAVAVYFMVS